MKKFCKITYKIAAYIAAFLLACMMIILVIQVFRRRVLTNSFTWAEELIRFMEIWLVFLGASLCVRDDLHPTVTIFADLLPECVKKYLKIIVHICVMIVGVIMIASGIMLCKKNIAQLTPTLQISYAWVYAAIPTSGVLIVLQSVGLLIEHFKSKVLGKPLEGGEES